MNKEEFLNIIANGLSDFPASERSEILYDYEQRFSTGLSQGKTEQEIINELGDPHSIVKHYIDTYSTRFRKKGSYEDTNYQSNTSAKSKSTGFWVLAIILLLILSPVILGVGFGILGLVVAFVAICFTIGVVGVGFIVSGLLGFNQIISHFSNVDINIPGSAQILLGIGSICLCILLIIGMIFVIKGSLFLIKQIINFFR